MFVVKELADCWEECPKPEEFDVPAVSSHDAESQPGDVKFLHRLGIRFPGDGDQP